MSEPRDDTSLDLPLGPRHRELLQTTATELYELAVAERGLLPDDPRLRGAERAEALTLLRDLGLLAQGRDSDRLLPRDPAEGQGRVVGPLGHRGAELIAESARWADVFTGLSQTWRKAPPEENSVFTEIRGGEAINRYLQDAIDDLTTEMLSAQPQAGRSMPLLVAGAERDGRALDRGVQIRTLYQHSARRSTATRAYVEAVTAKGAKVRTLDEFFNRLIILDRERAVIPAREGLEIALVIREPSIVAYLVDVFERSWERGRPFESRESSTMKDIAADQRAMTIRMLIEGHADPSAAKRMGVSTRTYAGYIADLKVEFDADTRFQLGHRMGRAGVTGEEDPHGE